MKEIFFFSPFQGLCEELDKQVIEYETMNEKLEEKMAKMEAENRNLGNLWEENGQDGGREQKSR
jgi:hypothetical protein